MTLLEQWRQLARQENRRARDLWHSGVADEAAGLDPGTVGTLEDRQTLAVSLKPVFEAGHTPDRIAVDRGIPEAIVWKALAVHMRETHKMSKCGLPLVFFRMRLARIQALRKAGLQRRDIAARLGVSVWLLDADLKRVRDAEWQRDVSILTVPVPDRTSGKR